MSEAQSIDDHSKLVSTWEKKSASGLSPAQHIHLLETGMLSVQQRASQTLSRVTLLVVLDRVLQQNLHKFPILSKVTLDPVTLKFNIDSHAGSPQDLIEALRFLLIDFLKVLGRITADILTIPLRDELMKVSWTEPEKK